MNERIPAAKMAEYGTEAGFTALETFELTDLILYVFDK